MEQQRRTRRITLNVDEPLLREAGDLLGTDSITETINRSLEATVNLHRRRRLIDHDFDLSAETLAEIRAPRFP